MNIILVSQVPHYFQIVKQKEELFPEFQVQTFWIKALEELGHSVEVYLYSNPVFGSTQLWSKVSYTIEQYFPKLFNKYRSFRNKYYQYFPDNIIRSKKLLNLTSKKEIDLVIFTGGISELGKISRENFDGIPVLLLHGVNPLEGATYFEKDHLDLFDQIVTNDPSHAKEWLKLGANEAYALPYSGIDSSFHSNKELERDIDVVFVGTLFKERQQFFIELMNQGVDFKLYGYVPKHEPLDKSLSTFYYGESWGDEVITIFNRSKIVINLVPSHMPVGGNLRTFEIPACGALQLANRCPKEWYQDSKEVVLFDDATDLAEKISYYLDKPKIREKIALAGFRITQEQYTYKKRFAQILGNLNHKNRK